jgi:hypothetical protein
MEALSTRLEQRPRDAVTLVSGHDARETIVRLTGPGLSQIERLLPAAAGKERG